VECVSDLHDTEVLSDKDLADEIGMLPIDIKRFHAEPFRVHQQLPEFILEMDRINATRLAHIERQTSNLETHEGYAQFCLFIRKLKAGMHFLRLGGDGNQHNTLVLMRKDNQGLKYMSATGKVALQYIDLVKG
jgi:hypothetical protein